MSRPRRRRTPPTRARLAAAERLEPRVVLSARSLLFPQAGSGPGQVSDTYVDFALPTTSFAASASLDIDLSSSLAPRQQALLRFGDVFGEAAGQIRPTDTIVAATLDLGIEGYVGNGLAAHRMLQPWTDSATWASLGNGIQTDGVEALAAADVTVAAFPAWDTLSLDVTASLRAWQADPAANFGWMITMVDGYNKGRFGSSESTAADRRPALTVVVDRAAALVSVSPVEPMAFEGTRPGAFVVSRTDTVGDLVVPYVLGGTAIAGTDYRPLPGSVTIPAGSHAATVTVIPLDDGAPESPESVTLQITSSAAIETDRATAGLTIRDRFDDATGLIVPLGETFSLESLPGARHTIYLDFLGSDQAWGSWNSGNPITTPAYDLDGDPTTFSNAERLAIQQCWEEMAEDFRPFEVNVTTVLPEAGRLVKTDVSDREWGIRCIFGDSTNWHEVSGGKAYLDSFTSTFEQPAWIAARTALGVIASHEVGHALGLNHDGDPGDEYYGGHGAGETRWGPIMGGPYEGLTQWDRGVYPGATNQEDDLLIITTRNGFGYRADDHADSSAQASPLVTLGGPLASRLATGTIERGTDVDWFEVTLPAGTHEITVDPAARIGNLDVRADLYDAAGALIATSNPVNEVSASFRQTLAAGRYFVRVDGDGNADPGSPGYDDYGSLGGYTVRVAPAATTLTFQQGVDGYAGTADTMIGRDFAATSKATSTSLSVDGRSSSYAVSTLLRFGDLFGDAAGRIPADAVIASATLDLNFVDPGAPFTVHRMLRSWADTDTYTSLVAGVTADGLEADATIVATSTTVTGWSSLDITSAVIAWLADPTSNHGLLLQPVTGTTNGNDIASAESATPPKLTVSYRLPAGTDDFVVDASASTRATLPELPADGVVRLVKRGAGVLVIDRANSHAGGTLVESGEAVIRNVAAFGSGLVEIAAGARVTFDVADGSVAISALSVAAGGTLDFGYGRATLAAGGYAESALQALLRSGFAAGWSAADGLTTRAAATVGGGGLGFAVHDDGSATIGFAVAGDTNVDGVVDLLDVSAMLAHGKFNTGDVASWSEGDANYDGQIDMLDISDFLAANHFNAGGYVPSPAAPSPPATGTVSATDAAFASLWTAANPPADALPKKRGRPVVG